MLGHFGVRGPLWQLALPLFPELRHFQQVQTNLKPLHSLLLHYVGAYLKRGQLAPSYWMQDDSSRFLEEVLALVI